MNAAIPPVPAVLPAKRAAVVATHTGHIGPSFGERGRGVMGIRAFGANAQGSEPSGRYFMNDGGSSALGPQLAGTATLSRRR